MASVCALLELPGHHQVCKIITRPAADNAQVRSRMNTARKKGFLEISCHADGCGAFGRCSVYHSYFLIQDALLMTFDSGDHLDEPVFADELLVQDNIRIFWLDILLGEGIWVIGFASKVCSRLSI